MGIFLLGTMCGNVFGPILGSVLASRWGWRSTQWFMVAYGAVVWVAIVLFLPNTSGAAVTTKKQKKSGIMRPLARETVPKEPKTTKGTIKAALWALGAPIMLIPLLRFPPVLITVMYTGISFAAYYCVMISIQATFSSPPYSFSTLIVGVIYIPNALGYLLAGTLGGRWTDRVMARRATAAGRFDCDNKPNSQPHDALGLNAWSAAIVYPAATLASGWTSDRGLHWVAPCIFNFFFAFGNMMIMSITTVMLTEFVPGRASAGVALANLVRNSLGAVACVVAQPLIDVIGVGWLFTAVAIISGAGAVCIWVLQRNSIKWIAEMATKLPQ